MRREAPLVLLVGVSLYELRIVESTLRATGFKTVAVQDADHATRELSANEALCVLVIDSGLLEAAHDPQWREFRRRHPGVGAAVRCLIPPDDGRQTQPDRNTLRVHPDDVEGLRNAVGVLLAIAGDSSAPPAPSSGNNL